MPLVAANASAAEGAIRGGIEGSERLITIVFVNLREPEILGKAKLPYDLLYILNQFFHEMTKLPWMPPTVITLNSPAMA